MRRKLKIKILYGIVGGERLGGRLRRELRHAGFIITKKRDEADIIIAHSAGCFWLHDVLPTQKLILIDPPYWPGRTINERAKQKMRTHFQYRQFGYGFWRWLAKDLWVGYYAIRDVRRTSRIWRHASEYDLLATIKGRDVILVRNESDTWLTPDFKQLEQSYPNIHAFELPGEHDDWYFNPTSYVNLLKSLV